MGVQVSLVAPFGGYMKIELDPIEQEVERVLFEMYSKELKYYYKECDTFCGNSCKCKKRISATERDWIRREVQKKLRV